MGQQQTMGNDRRWGKISVSNTILRLRKNTLSGTNPF